MRGVNMLTHRKFLTFVRDIESENLNIKTEFHKKSLTNINWDYIAVFDELIGTGGL